MRALLAITLLLAACSSSTTRDPTEDSGVRNEADAGRIPCPEDPPSNGDPCSDGSPSCSWLRCGAEGAITASCSGAAWNVTTSACPTSCDSETCAAGEICQSNEGGALIQSCVDDPCDGAALEECACAICPNPSACYVTGFVVHCNTCAAAICP